MSAYNFFSHGISSALNLQNGNFGFYHPLANSGLSLESSVNLINDQWYHLHKQIDQENGVAKLFVNGAEAVSDTFDPSQAIESDIESDWLVGTGTISSILDEIRISGGVRSDDWIVASYQNQMENPLFPTYPGNLDGPPSFLTAHDFTIFAETEFTHFAKATGGPTAYVASGLPSGLLLNPIDGNLSGSPTYSGTYEPMLRAFYDDGTQSMQPYQIEVLTSPPDISLSPPQSAGASFGKLSGGNCCHVGRVAPRPTLGESTCPGQSAPEKRAGIPPRYAACGGARGYG